MKTVISTLDEVPEALRGEYEERDGRFALKVEGEVPGLVKAAELSEANSKLIEFRDNNRVLNLEKLQLEEKLKRFDGIDLEEHAKLKERIGELEKKGVKGGDDIAALVQKGIAAAVEPLQKRLDEAEAREKASTAALSRKNLESRLTTAGLKAGVEEKAIPDYIRRGFEVFHLENGDTVVAKDGDTPLFSKEKPAQPLTVEEWVSNLVSDAPHLFKASKGGGATPSPGGQGAKHTIPNDPVEIGKHLESVAKGETVVSPE